MLLVFAAVAVGSGLALRAWYRRPLAIVLDPVTLRLSPARPRPGAGSGRERQRRAAGRTRSAGWVLVRAAGGREGWVPDAAVAADRRLDSRHVATHRHPARRRRRSDRRGRGRRAPGLGGEGAGRERARRGRPPRARRAGERRQDAHPGGRRRHRHGPRGRGARPRSPCDQQGPERRRSRRGGHVRLSRRGASRDRVRLPVRARSPATARAAPSSP